MKQNILIIGSGGREHAIGWKLLQSPRVGHIYFAPGNGGTEKLGTNVPINVNDIPKLLEFAKSEKIDITLALPHDPLILGIVDLFQKAGLRIFGPTHNVSRLEASKSYAKKFMEYYNLPTAQFETFTDLDQAKEYISTQVLPIVIKVNGLSMSKGVFICHTSKEVHDAIHEISVKRAFGKAEGEIVVEEYLEGIEISVHAFTDSNTHVLFPATQDHKRIGEGDIGPLTAGMGSVAPLPFVDAKLFKEIEALVIKPSISALAADNLPFQGVLYPGIMITPLGPKMLEFNARFGDPETQTYMRLLDTDLLDIIEACIEGRLNEIEVKWKPQSACTVVLASAGYPGGYKKGKTISGINLAEEHKDIVVFHAGTVYQDGFLVTDSGRVLGVSAIGDSIQEALEKAYAAIKKIEFEGMYYRKDIGKNVLALGNKKHHLH